MKGPTRTAATPTTATPEKPRGPDNLLDGAAALAEAGLRALLDVVDCQALIARADGDVVYASRAADERLLPALEERARAGEAPLETIANHLEGTQIRWLPEVDGERYALVWFKPGPDLTESPLDRAQRNWQLTRRQREVLCLLAEGKANRAIAALLSCSERTVELHVASLFRKAGCDSRTALVAKFWRSQA